jgi:predicted PurR-regulated permease PerM
VENRGKLLVVILSVLVALLAYLSYAVIRPFIIPILWAVVLSIAFHPMHRALSRRIRSKGFASLVTLIIILLIILGPVAYLLYRFVAEMIYLAGQMKSQIGNQGGIHDYASRYVDEILAKMGIPHTEFYTQAQAFLTNLGKQLALDLKEKLSQTFIIAFDFLVMAFALFFMLRGGESAVRNAVSYVPLSKERKDRMQALVTDIVSSTFYGTGVSMGIHGLLGLLLFMLLGVPAPVLLAAGTALFSVVPIVGSLPVWAGAIIYLIAKGKITHAIVMTAIAGVGTQVTDHWLRPLLVGAHGNLPFIVVFIGVLGGLEVFGLIGLVLGPLVLILFESAITLSLEVWNDRP